MATTNKKVAIITGGSSGLGKALAAVFLEQDYALGIIARDQEKLEKSREELFVKPSYQINTFQADIASIPEMKAATEKVTGTFKSIDFLVLNAGIVQVKLLQDYQDYDELKAVIETNLWGTILTARCLVPLVANGGKILLISSYFGLMGAAGYTTYCATKGGIITFADALRRELLSRNIEVYVACIPDIDTPQYRNEIANVPHWMNLKDRDSLLPVKSCVNVSAAL